MGVGFCECSLEVSSPDIVSLERNLYSYPLVLTNNKRTINIKQNIFLIQCHPQILASMIPNRRSYVQCFYKVVEVMKLERKRFKQCGVRAFLNANSCYITL